MGLPGARKISTSRVSPLARFFPPRENWAGRLLLLMKYDSKHRFLQCSNSHNMGTACVDQSGFHNILLGIDLRAFLSELDTCHISQTTKSMVYLRKHFDSVAEVGNYCIKHYV